MSKKGWGWREGPYAEVGYGPFPSKKAALDDACKRLDRTALIRVGLIEYPRFETQIDANWIIEHADEVCGENDFSFYDDVIFEPKGDAEQADIELKAFLRRWAKKYVSTSPCWAMGMNEPEEDVRIEAGKEVSDD